MTRRSQLGGSSRVTALHGFAWNSATSLGLYSPCVTLLSGACTANTWKTVLSITGSRIRLNILMMSFLDSTARTGQLRVTIDGQATPAFDSTATNASGSTHLAIGQIVGGATNSVLFHPVDANASVLIEYKGSLTETDKARFDIAYELRV